MAVTQHGLTNEKDRGTYHGSIEVVDCAKVRRVSFPWLTLDYHGLEVRVRRRCPPVLGDRSDSIWHNAESGGTIA